MGLLFFPNCFLCSLFHVEPVKLLKRSKVVEQSLLKVLLHVVAALRSILITSDVKAPQCLFFYVCASCFY